MIANQKYAITKDQRTSSMHYLYAYPGDSIEIDCSGLEFIDSSGLRMLVYVGDRAGKKVVLLHAVGVALRSIDSHASIWRIGTAPSICEHAFRVRSFRCG